MSSVDAAKLLSAASEDRSTYAFTHVPADAAAMHAYVRRAVRDARSGTSVPLVVRSVGPERVIGTTRFLDLAGRG